MSNLPRSDSVQIREVWEDNLVYEINLIRNIVDSYPYIAMDTEYPGTVIVPLSSTGVSNNILYYQTIKANVDVLKLIQVGLTFFDDKGNLPSFGNATPCIWQFNFEFDPTLDRHNDKSIGVLVKSGIDFNKNKEKGVNGSKFGEFFMTSEAVLKDNVHWVTFHGGYDLAYLLKLLTGKDLPETIQEFFDLVKTFFPNLYDVKHLIRFTNNVYGSLKEVAGQLGVKDIGSWHQAGADSWLTCGAFLRLKEDFRDRPIEKYAGVLPWLGCVDERDKPS